MIKIYGTIGKVLSWETGMPNMIAPCLMVRKLCANLKFSKCRSKVTVKVTWSKFWYHQKVLVIRNTHAKYESPISQGKLDMCLRNTDAPGGKKVKIWQKSVSPTFCPPHPRGMWCHWSVRNSSMNLQSNFGYSIITQTLNIALCL